MPSVMIRHFILSDIMLSFMIVSKLLNAVMLSFIMVKVGGRPRFLSPTRGAQKLAGENLKLVWAEFLTIS
jgi:hypothetical protein